MVDREKPQRVGDYFVVAGLGNGNSNDAIQFDEDRNLSEPITDVTVIFKSLGEKPPKGYTCIEETPAGFPANLNHGSIRQPSCFLCIRRGTDKPPLTDIGVLYEGKERLMAGCDIVLYTATGKEANVNNSGGSRTFITYRRASQKMAHSSLAVTEICVIITSKSEKPPHAFCLIDKNLNKGMVGSDVYLCYRKSLARLRSITYPAEVLSRFPVEDYEGFPLPDKIPMFCLPQGAVIECWPENSQHPLPSFSTFVLTGASGQKIYGAAVTFFEVLSEDQLTEERTQALQLNSDNNYEEGRKVAHTNKCICVLSHWPFFEAFKKFLSQLYRISVSAQPFPIERYIAILMLDVPFPSPQRPRILVQTNMYDPFEICQPYHTPLPVSGASYTAMLRYLHPEHAMLLFFLILTEHKILIHSLRPALMTSIAEALTTLLFPFSWQCPYVPLCPLGLNDVLDAPCPFVVGIDSRYFDQYDPPDDVTCVDLDTNTISLEHGLKGVGWKSLPKKPGKVLEEKLNALFYQLYQLYHKERETSGGDITETAIELAPLDHDNSHSRKRLQIEVAIQDAFLRFMATILKGYELYLKPITSAPTQETCDLTSLFDLEGFLRSRPSSQSKFFQTLTRTQMFSRFIEQRSFVTSQDSLLAFFDNCLEKVEVSPDTPLIEVDDSVTRGGQRTYVVTPPDVSNMDKGKLYSYPVFPVLNVELMKPEKLSLHAQSIMTPPVSPVARRTRAERHQSVLMAKKNSGSPINWAKCLLAHCYSLWFIHLPAYVKIHHNKAKVLHVAFQILCKMKEKGVKLPDEVCYRVLMQLCGQYGHPALAVKVLFEMKYQGITPNAVTYGYYNRAVMEGKWPSNTTSSHMWNKLRNFFAAVYELQRLAKLSRNKEDSLSPSGSNGDLDLNESPRRTLKKPDRSRTPSREREKSLSHERLLDLGDSTENHGGRRTPERDVKSRRERTISEMSTASETNDILNLSAASIDGAGFPPFPKLRQQTQGRTTSETSVLSAAHSQLFINANSEDSDPYEYTTKMLDDVILGLPLGLQPDTALEAVLCTCHQCVKCGRYLYDEDILAAWTADDSNLNTGCPYCQTQQVASLTIKIKDYRNCFSSHPSSDLSSSINSFGSSELLPTDVDDEPKPGNLSSSFPSTIESSAVMNKHSSLPRPISASLSPPPSNPVPIRGSHHRMRYSISAPSSASGSPSGSLHGSPRPGSWIQRARNSNSTCSHGSSWYVSRPPEERDLINVPYLNPLVLRKELENMFENDGIDTLQSPEVVQEKSIIFWNLVWYFKRLELPSHLAGHVLSTYPSNERPDKAEDRRSISGLGTQVLVSTSWDGDREEYDMVPLYVLWNAPADQQGSLMDKGLTTRSVMQSVVAHVQENDVTSPTIILLEERNRQKNINPNAKWSVYRELLFLTLTACGAEYIDIDCFDKEYRSAYKRIFQSKNHSDMLCLEDKSPPARAVYCRRAFDPPTLQPRIPQYLVNAFS
ncbi:C-myc promoter-binding protein-like [Montipora capricornis]|uniref:C-myc promoter-binding protein-like n=1 Tax=Montipora capricornis TaxID=246305 RepID=UPI0035F10DDD